MADDILALESFLPYRLNRLADAVSREFAGTYRDRHGLTRPEWRVFATLGQFGTMTATAIGAHSAMHKTKVSRAVVALEQRKWLMRTPDASDRRIEHLALTKAGVTAYREMVPLAKAFEKELLRRLKRAQATALMEGLTALEAGLLGSGAASAPGTAHQSITTLPELPLFMASKPSR
ncbi:MarR family winged helix-turn-helix transcriptional regulator [Borborobacter arsenicus]|uniref:MarR family winged helix-turn-helix transcriptional regulator n=1 Tax=Borborobacter arsenicus TaxID=1851146 RepID=UPI0026D7A24A